MYLRAPSCASTFPRMSCVKERSPNLSRVDPVMGDALAQAVKDYLNVQRVRIKTFDEPDPTRWDFETDH